MTPPEASPAGSLVQRFRAELCSLVPTHSAATPLLVALSGGLDSTVLLHLLRFAVPDLPIAPVAAHFDHRMRPSSAGDARWTRGLCRAWSVPLETGTAVEALRGEAAARTARYRFLRSAAQRQGARFIVTAHHADDQAETVLFRVVRGTGVRGLRGIPRRSGGGVVRPLLGFWREELEGYALEHGVRWREDPTNRGLDPARNRIRHLLLPEIERSVAPGARRSLVRLAQLAAEEEAGWRARVDEAAERVVRKEGGAVLVARSALAEYHPALGSRVLRRVLRGFGAVPGRIGTRSALQFITDAPSGREMRLPGGVRIRIEFEAARIERAAEPEPDRPLVVDREDAGGPRTGSLRLGGRSYRVEIGGAGGASEGAGWSVRLPLTSLDFPLVLRGRRPGDRVATRAGTRSLKKLMIERRVPASERAARPVLADAAGRVLWVPDLHEPKTPEPSEDAAGMLQLTIRDE